jgi:hypothetical protein
METMEGLSERLEALENQIRAVKRRLHCWHGIACGQTRRRPRRAHCSATLLLAALIVCALAPAGRGQAADFSCGNGDAACLITAINMANANGDANTITLKAGTYTLTAVDNNTDGPNGLPAITSVLTIKGTRAATTILERDTSAPAFRILNVAATGKLTLQRLTLRNGFTGVFEGGGIFNNSGTLTLIDSILNRNSAALCAGLLNNNGTVTIIHTTFDGNETTQNFPGGGLCNGLSLGDNVFFEGGTVTIANSTFVHNIADGSGGLFNRGTMTLTNTTVAQNVAVLRPGAITNDDGILLLQNTTVAENHSLFGGAGGIVNNNGIVLLQNTILARNDTFPPSGGGPVSSDCFGPLTSLGNNLIGDPTRSGCAIILEPSDLTGDPGLGTFTDNGTPGNGHFPLLSSSQAIDAGNNAVCFSRDQLGRRRVGPCDIGAISFRGKDDGRLEEKDDHQHEENLVSRVQGSR